MGKYKVSYGEVVPLVNQILNQYTFSLTVRQIYYRLISDPYNLFPNTRSCYASFDRVLVKARERGDIDEKRIEDRTRQTIGGDYGWPDPDSFLNDVLDNFSSSWQDYQKEIWLSQQFKLEVWVEKDALAGVVNQAAKPYRVLVFPSRGYSSYTKMKDAIQRLSYYDDKQRVILHLADHDPSGIDMTDDLIRRFKKYGGDSIRIERIALNFDQVKKFNLRPNPVKKADSRSSSYVMQYGHDCWELDALPPDELQNIVKRAIEKYIDPNAWQEKLEEIRKERKFLKRKIVKMMGRIQEVI